MWPSPHAWGCSGGRLPAEQGEYVVPTRVGVFRSRRPPGTRWRFRPRARGVVARALVIVPRDGFTRLVVLGMLGAIVLLSFLFGVVVYTYH
jgi:hypothetical protein